MLGELGLAHAGRPNEQERADRAARILEVRAGTPQRPRNSHRCDLLTDDHLLEFAFEQQQLLALLLLHPAQRNARPVGHDLQHQVVVNGDALLFTLLLPLFGDLFEPGTELFLLVAELGGLLEMLLGDRRLLLRADRFDLLVQGLDVRRTAERGNARPRTGFVHDVDRLVGEKTTGDVPVGKLGRRLHGLVGEHRPMVVLVLAANALEDQYRVGNRGRLDLDRLESAIQRAVLFDILPVLVQRGRPDALHFAAGERRLKNIGGVHRTLGRAGAHDGVQLIDEKDDVLGTFDLVHHRLDAFLELAPVFRAGHHECEVERDDLLVRQDFGNGAARDLLRQTLDDRGFADARLSDEHRVVLGAATENLDYTTDLGPPAHHRIEFALVRQFGQVAAEGLQRRRLDILLVLGAAAPAGRRRRRLFAASLAGELRIEFTQDFLPRPLDVDIEGSQHARRDALTLPEQAE